MSVRVLRGPLVRVAALFLIASSFAAACRAEPPGRRVSELDTGSDPAALAAADLNGDGNIDLMASSGDSVLVLAGDGAGRFRPLGRLPAGANPVDLHPADLDGDGRLDLLIANHDTDYVTLLRGDGKGGFAGAPNSPLRLDLDPHPHVARAVDIDGDGRRDLLVDERGREGIRLLRGLGGGRFERPGMLIPVGGDPYRGMRFGDLNGDGRPDMVTPNPREVAVMLNEAGHGLRRTGAVQAEAPFGVVLADLNGDGTLDLLSASESGTLDMFRGLGDGRFERIGEPRRVAAGGKRFVRGDFNGDGTDDAAMVSYQSPEVTLVTGGRDGVSLSSVGLPGRNPWGLAAADFDGDGRDDLAVGDEGTDRVYILLSGRPGD